MLNQKSINLIKSFEGCHLACYHLDDGVCTIGYGHTRPLSQCAGAGTWTISQQQAEDFLQNDLSRYRNAVMGYFTRNLNENQIGALTSFCYNLGTGIFAKYSFPKNGTDGQITAQMMLFLNKGTQFEAGITRRRQAETALFSDGAVQSSQAAPIQLKKENLKMKPYIFNVVDANGKITGGTMFFDGIRTIAFAGPNAEAALNHIKGTYKQTAREDLPTQTKTQGQFDLWGKIYKIEYIKF